MGRELLWGDLEAIKLFSMREHPQVSYLYRCLKEIHVIDYYPFMKDYVIMSIVIKEYVIMSIAITGGIFSSRGQSAWVHDKRYSHLLVSNKRYSTRQRLNKEYLNKSKD